MERKRRPGLRDLICFGRSESPKKAAKSSAQRSLEYRQRFTPEELEEYRVQARERAYKQYHKMLDEEEKAARREASRLRSKQYRDRKKAERSSDPLATSTPKPKTRKAIGEQRQLWREQKRQQRSQWGPQKKRRHREKSLAYYYTKKASSEHYQTDEDGPRTSGTKSRPHQELSDGDTLIISVDNSVPNNGNYTFKRSWFQVSKKHIASDGRHAFFDNYLTCIQCTSTLDEPHKKFSIKRNSAAKIEDALVMEGFPETINLPYKGYRASVFAVTKDRFLLRIDLETGEIVEEVYIDCPSFVYNALNKKIQWNVVDESFTIISKKGLLPGHVPPGAGGETKMIELTVMSCMPLQFHCCFAVTKKTFGKDVVEAAVFLNILMVMHSTDYVRMYSLEKIMEENCIHQQKLYEKCGDESYYGVFPTSLTHNINLDVKPDCLFEVRCQNRDVMLTMPPCYYVMWPHGDPGGYCCYSFETGKMVKGGRLEAEENAIEERVSLHADDSGRIIHMKTSELRVLKLKAGRFDEEKCLVEDYAINFAEERQSQLPVLKVSQSGRIIKQRVMQDCGQLAERTVQTMVYDEDLDMMIVVSLTNPASDVDDNQSCTVVGFYDNWTGHLLRQFVLEDSAVETLEQSICFSQDTLTHTFKTTFGKFECHVYKLKPLQDMEDEFRLRGKMKSEKKRNSFGTQLRRQRSRRRISRSHR